MFNDSASNTTGIQITGTGGNNTVSPAFMTFSNTLTPIPHQRYHWLARAPWLLTITGPYWLLNTTLSPAARRSPTGSTLNIGDAGLTWQLRQQRGSR